MNKRLLFIALLCPLFVLNAQEWQILGGEPEGGGVTDIYADPESGELFVATGSLNWPGGEDGGIRKSTNDGNTWTNVFDAYTSRFVFRGPDDNLYASVWDYPSDEGLYRSTDNGSTWDLLTSVPSGNNIFCAVVKEGSPNTLFAGTGAGVLRSYDNGNNWSYANNGLPSGAWVRSMAITPDGETLAAGTTAGLYISTDDGDTWEQVTGDGEGEIISSVMFYEEVSADDMNIYVALFGSETGAIYATSTLVLFLVATLVTNIAPQKGVTRIMMHRNPVTLAATFMISLWAATGGDFFFAVGGMINWQSFLTGLPPNPFISVFTTYLNVATLVVVAYIAMYGNASEALAGCEIYKATFDLTVGDDVRPYSDRRLALEQNIPNPFRNQTRINFELGKPGPASLQIYDMAGHPVKMLANGILAKGKHSIEVNSEGLSRGMYYYVLQSGDAIVSRKLVIE